MLSVQVVEDKKFAFLKTIRSMIYPQQKVVKNRLNWLSWLTSVISQGPTIVTIGVDIKDIPKVSDQDFSITLNAYFNVKWRDPRLLVSREVKFQVQYLIFNI